MKVNILEEAGYDQALRGMAYSYKDRSLNSSLWWEGQREKASKRASGKPFVCSGCKVVWTH